MSAMAYCLVEVDDGGYMRLQGEGEWSDGVYHRGHSVTPDVPLFNTLAEAKGEWAGADSDQAILALDTELKAYKLWFARTQVERGVSERLNKWRGCYGAIPLATLSSA